MRIQLKFLVGAAIFAIALVCLASNSEAFNTFKSAQDESRMANSSDTANAVRELRDINLQILEELKKMNQNLGNVRSTSTAVPAQPATPSPVPGGPVLMRANP